jgi:hypothetical protein
MKSSECRYRPGWKALRLAIASEFDASWRLNFGLITLAIGGHSGPHVSCLATGDGRNVSTRIKGRIAKGVVSAMIGLAARPEFMTCQAVPRRSQNIDSPAGIGRATRTGVATNRRSLSAAEVE